MKAFKRGKYSLQLVQEYCFVGALEVSGGMEALRFKSVIVMSLNPGQDAMSEENFYTLIIYLKVHNSST